MSYYLHFDKLITNGRIRTLIVNINNPAKPENRKAWLILCGYIQFTTGTSMHLEVIGPDLFIKQKWVIDSTEANGYYALFGNYSSDASKCLPTWCPIIVTDVDMIRMQSGAMNTIAFITVLEWDT
jgi:hypothetical protein